MRIAYVCADSGVPAFGQKGCSIHLQEVIRAFRRSGAKVELFAAHTRDEPPPDLADVHVHVLPKAPKGSTNEREKAACEANWALRDALEKAGEFDLIYERYSLWSFAAMEYAQKKNMPGLLEVNAPLIDEQTEHRELIDRAGAEQLTAKVFRDAAAIVAVSKEVAEHVSRFVQDLGEVYVVANGVDPQRFPQDRKPSLGATPGTFTIGFVGTLKPWHGLGYLVEAFARLCRSGDKYRLLIVGDGPERSRIEEDLRARSLLDAVCFTGAVKPDEIPGLLASMDAAVAPYPPGENFYFSPLKVYEYMAARLPIVASRMGQLEDVIRDGINGLLVPAGDADAIADALEQLQCDAELRIRLGKAARETVIKKQTWDVVARRILKIAADLKRGKFLFGDPTQLAEVAG